MNTYNGILIIQELADRSFTYLLIGLNLVSIKTRILNILTPVFIFSTSSNLRYDLLEFYGIIIDIRILRRLTTSKN